ncbi:hypothetical protein PHYBOEH_004764 [Phytophthora boehmeriae]|uniref:Uncharacterized protein n=1 Tax=Phytophthora boehmeriae TaxID=109152 RepID=A0A8T1X3Q2_9STRA|nr:hypothetical protein PHYBOEH_004764 [Phytophthora boehmeriae]
MPSIPPKYNQRYLRELEQVLVEGELHDKYPGCWVVYDEQVWVLLTVLAQIHHDHRRTRDTFAKMDMLSSMFAGEYLYLDDDGVGEVKIRKEDPFITGDVYVRFDHAIYYKPDDTIYVASSGSPTAESNV